MAPRHEVLEQHLSAVGHGARRSPDEAQRRPVGIEGADRQVDEHTDVPGRRARAAGPPAGVKEGAAEQSEGEAEAVRMRHGRNPR